MSILVVDDEAAMRELYKRMLVAAGYLALEASTAEEGLDYLALNPEIHTVVADLNMPGHGGAWLVDQLRQRFPTVAVILATADAQVPGAVSLQRSVVTYIVKPVSRERLLEAVKKALAWHEQQTGAQPGRAADGDPIEAFLDKKLTRGDGGRHE